MIRHLPKDKNKFRHKFRIYRAVAIVNIGLLVLNITAYFFVLSPQVLRTKAEETIVCMRICEAGDTACLATGNTCIIQPVVTTQAVTSITTSTATGHGTVVTDGYATITERGTVIATTVNPSISDTKDIAAGTTGSFTTRLEGLLAGTLYHVRAFASNSAYTSYGSDVTFTTSGSSNAISESTVGGGGAPGSIAQVQVPTKPTLSVSDYLISIPIAHDASVPLVVLDLMQDHDNGLATVSTDVEGRPLLRTLRPHFQGITNIKNALIYITLRSKVVYGTTQADATGRWDWVTPQDLEPGLHSFMVQAVSPDNSDIVDTRSYEFVIVSDESEIVPPQSIPSPTTQVPSIIGKPELPFVDEPRYSLDVDLVDSGQALSVTNEIPVRLKIIDISSPDIPQELEVTFNIYDSKGVRVFSQKKKVTILGQLTDLNNLVLGQELAPGMYIISASIEYQGQLYVATQIITIVPETFIATPLLTISRQQAEKGLLATSVGLSLMLVVFGTLMIREFRRAKLVTHIVSGDDLLNSGMV